MNRRITNKKNRRGKWETILNQRITKKVWKGKKKMVLTILNHRITKKYGKGKKKMVNNFES